MPLNGGKFHHARSLSSIFGWLVNSKLVIIQWLPQPRTSSYKVGEQENHASELLHFSLLRFSNQLSNDLCLTKTRSSQASTSFCRLSTHCLQHSPLESLNNQPIPPLQKTATCRQNVAPSKFFGEQICAVVDSVLVLMVRHPFKVGSRMFRLFDDCFVAHDSWTQASPTLKCSCFQCFRGSPP